jgi:hypothetical protein
MPLYDSILSDVFVHKLPSKIESRLALNFQCRLLFSEWHGAGGYEIVTFEKRHDPEVFSVSGVCFSFSQSCCPHASILRARLFPCIQ